MSGAKDISVKAFAEELESRLAALTAEDLRQLVREMAREVTPAGRREFLERLQPRGQVTVDAKSLGKVDALLDDIADLQERLEDEMEDPHYESWHDYDDESAEAYEDFTPELEGLFDRCRAAFDVTQTALARDAYAALFKVLELEDDYGRGVTLPASVEMDEEMARYLRAVVETAENRSECLLKAWGDLCRSRLDACDLALEAIFEITPAPLEGREALLEDLITRLRDQAGYESDRWLRTAVRLRHGEKGLAELARAEGDRRPHAWLDWLSVIAAEDNPARLFAAAQEALNRLPEGLSLRAVAADYWFQAASALEDKPAALQARWEAFRANPSVGRLLDLWDAADEPVRPEWMTRAADEARKERPKPDPIHSSGPFSGQAGQEEQDADEADEDEDEEDEDEWPFEEASDEEVFLGRDDGVSGQSRRIVAACARLLAGNLAEVLDTAKGEPALGWSSSGNTQALVLPVLFAYLAGWPERALTATLAEVFEAALGRCNDWHKGERVQSGERFKEKLAQVVPDWKLTPAQRTAIRTACIDLATRRVNAIVEGLHRGAYDRAAILAVAAAEVLLSCESASAANQLLDDLAARHKRKHAFTRELTQRRQRMGKGRELT